MMGRMAILRVHVVPNAKSDSVVAARWRSQTARIGGRRQAALVRFLAEQMKLPLYAIVLKRGEKSRDKVIQIHGLSEEDVRNRLSERD